VKLASSVVSQRQLNQSGSHRPNLRKILYVINNWRPALRKTLSGQALPTQDGQLMSQGDEFEFQ
jgi:hypothetical protein